MNQNRARYRGHRFPPAIISYAIWAYHRFALSFRDVEDLLVERGVAVSYESIRRWCLKFGPRYQRALQRREGRLGDDWFVDEVFVSIAGQQYYLYHDTDKYANNRAENSHQHTRRRKRQMQRFKSKRHAQRFLGLHARVGNLFRYGRHLLRAVNHRLLRAWVFATWRQVTCGVIES